MSGATGPVEAGRLLVATPALLDPNFERTVVLLLDADEDGVLGVVLNRPSTVEVSEILPDWSGAPGSLGVLFAGGPVGTDSALAVAALKPDRPTASPTSSGEDGGEAPDDTGDGEPVGFRRLYDSVGVVDLDTPTEVVTPALSGMRIFAGYAGWTADQLREEIEEGAWYVLDAEPGDLFGRDPRGLWARVLRRQPGELAWVSTRPQDPTLN